MAPHAKKVAHPWSTPSKEGFQGGEWWLASPIENVCSFHLQILNFFIAFHPQLSTPKNVISPMPPPSPC